MTHNMNIIQAFANYDDGLTTEAECHAALDAEQVRGAFRPDGSYLGYDYRDQVWIDEPA